MEYIYIYIIEDNDIEGRGVVPIPMEVWLDPSPKMTEGKFLDKARLIKRFVLLEM